MYPVSEEFQSLVRRSHTIATKVELLREGEVTMELNNVLNGYVRVNKTAEVRRTAYLAYTDPTPRGSSVFPTNYPVPVNPSDIPSRLGTEFKIWRGVVLGNGTAELVPQGVFPIDKAYIQDSGDGFQVRIEGKDRSTTVSNTPFRRDTFFPAGSNVGDIIQQIVSARLPNIDYQFAWTPFVTPELEFKMGSDPWSAVVKLADSVGYELFFDRDGACVFRLVPDPIQKANSFNYVESSGDSPVLYWDVIFAYDEMINHVIVQGEDNLLGEAIDTDPNSVTYAYGHLGDRIKVYTASGISDHAQLNAMALGILNRVKGIGVQTDFPMIPDSSLDVGDKGILAPQRVDSFGYSIDNIALPIQADAAMNMTCRQVSLT